MLQNERTIKLLFQTGSKAEMGPDTGDELTQFRSDFFWSVKE